MTQAKPPEGGSISLHTPCTLAELRAWVIDADQLAPGVNHLIGIKTTGNSITASVAG
jgi:hypothetical protein